MNLREPKEALRQGVFLLPEDRKSEGIFAHLDVRENVVLAQDEACCRRPLALRPGDDLEHRLVQEGPLRFRILDAAPERHTRFLQPLYGFPAFWPYWVYFDLDAPPLY